MPAEVEWWFRVWTKVLKIKGEPTELIQETTMGHCVELKDLGFPYPRLDTPLYLNCIRLLCEKP